MKATLRSVVPLLVGTAMLQVGAGLVMTFLGVRMELEEFGKLAIGCVGVAYFTGYILGTLHCSKLIQRVGHIRTYSALAASLSSVTLLAAVFINPFAWGILRVIAGFCLVGLFIVTESWINEKAENETRGQIFSLYMIVSYVALGAGQFLLPLAPPQEVGLFLAVSILFSLALVPVALTRATAPLPFEGSRFSFKKLYEVSPLAVAGCVASGAMSGAFYVLGPVFAREIGSSMAGVSKFMGIAILSGLILQWPLGKLSDAVDRRLSLVATLLVLSGISVLSAYMTNPSTFSLVILPCLFGGVVFTIYPLSVAHANDSLQPWEFVDATGGLLLAYAIGASIGPIPASLLMSQVGPKGLHLFIAGVSGMLMVFGIHRILSRPSALLPDQEPFISSPRTSTVISQLDPRAIPNDPTGEDSTPQ